MRERKSLYYKVVLSAFFIALGIVLPFVTMQIPKVGNMLLPMHIPVIICGFLCGAPYGLAVGFITPLLRSLLVGMPMLFPNAAAMAVELATYGFVSGFVYQKIYKRKGAIFISLVTAMLMGRIVWGLTSAILYSVMGNLFTWKIFLTLGFINAIPGIVIQLIFIPLLVNRMKFFKNAQVSS